MTRRPFHIATALCIVVAAGVAAGIGSLSWAGNLALLILLAGAGALLAPLTARVQIAARPEVARRVGIALIAGLGAAMYLPPLLTDGGFLGKGDWGVHHALVQVLVDAGGIPPWVPTVSTGDPSFELYPALPYLLAAAVVRWLGGDVITVLYGIGAAAHVLIAIGSARLAYRMGHWSIGWGIGVVALLDTGGYSGGGSYAVIQMGLYANAVSQALFLLALPSVLDALVRPRARTTAAIWLFTALAAAAHPTGLLQVGVVCIGLIAVAALARDVRPARALAVVVHLGIGAALAAVVWAPLGAKLVAYGLHYSNAPAPPWDLVRLLLAADLPEHTFAVLTGIALLGVVLGLWSRRALPLLVAAAVLAVLFFATALPYLFFELAPSPASARLGVHRLPSLVKPLVHAAAAYALARALAGREPALPWSAGRRALAGALALVFGFLAVRAVVPWVDFRLDEQERELRWRGPAPEDFDQLTAWLKARPPAGPGRVARLLYDGRENFSYHLGALTGVPVLFASDVPILFLRDRIEDTAPDSLARFGVRWVFRWDAPPDLGDAKTEVRLGRFFVREVPGWDGQLARVEAGAGQARVLEAGERMTVEVTGGPALVVFGLGWWPRWQARHEDGRALPVYARWATSRKEARVLAAWLPPGRTVFTCDRALPEDSRGRALSWAAAGLVLAGSLLFASRRLRRRSLRLVARGTRTLRRHRLEIALATVALASIGLAVRAAIPEREPALVLGQGLQGRAAVLARRVKSDDWTRCTYSVARGHYVCPDLGYVYTTMDERIPDAAPSWPFPVPIIAATSIVEDDDVEFVIGMRRRLAGDYVASAGPRGNVHLSFVDEVPRKLTPNRLPITIPRGEHRVRLAMVATPLTEVKAAVVLEESLDRSRKSDVPWAPAAPAW